MPLLPMKKIWTPLELFRIYFFKDQYYGSTFYRLGKSGKMKKMGANYVDQQ